MRAHVIKQIEVALRLHINYEGKSSGGEYLEVMDCLAWGYSGSLSEKLSAMLSDYYASVGVNNLDEAHERLRQIDKKKEDEKI